MRRRREYLVLAARAIVFAPIVVVVALVVATLSVLGAKAIQRGATRPVDGDGRALRSSRLSGRARMGSWWKHALTAVGSAALGAVIGGIGTIGPGGMSFKTIGLSAAAAAVTGFGNYIRQPPDPGK